MMGNKSKIYHVLHSRKFWSAIVGLLVSIGIITLSDSQQAELIGGIMTVMTTMSYIFGVAIEDYARHNNNQYFD